jgi:hypothetical protein
MIADFGCGLWIVDCGSSTIGVRARNGDHKIRNESAIRNPQSPIRNFMKILFAGIIARYPFGGVTWCSLMYLLGLRALGHEVFYIEDTGECVYDPVQNPRHRTDLWNQPFKPRYLRPRRSVGVRQLRRQLSRAVS